MTKAFNGVLNFPLFMIMGKDYRSLFLATFIQKAKGCVRSLFSFSSQMPELLKEMLKEIILILGTNDIQYDIYFRVSHKSLHK